MWSDELEQARPETRAAVVAGIGLFNREGDVAGVPQAERIAKRRAAMAPMTVPEALDREIAGVRCRVYLPDGSAPRAVYLHVHGGGMVSGSPDVMDVPNLRMARDLGVAVVSPDYRKAPEHPFPAGPDDVTAVAEWLVEHAAGEFGVARLLMGGESAGAYLTAVVALRLRDRGRIAAVAGLNLVFGIYDWGHTPSQRGRRPHDGPDVLSPEEIDFVTGCYLPGLTIEQRRDPAISPGLCRSSRPAADVPERGHDRPPRRRHAAVGRARRGGGARRRAVRPARDAPRLHGLPVHGHHAMGGGHGGLARRAHRPASAPVRRPAVCVP